VIGSGEGVNRFLTGSLDFAATDAPLTSEQEAAVPGGVTHVPVTSGMVVIAYHLPDDLPGELRLSREVYGDIFAGKITRWDDPRIAAANPDLELPDRSIVVVARLDGSGTTFAFANHLHAASHTWRDAGVDASTRVDWPGNTMLARGNEGVAVNIMRGYGTIGYVEYGFASRLGLPMAALENAAGVFVKPAPASGEAAIASAQVPDDLKIELPDPAGTDAYPIVTFTWSLLRNRADDLAKARAIRTFTRWAITEGQGLVPDLGYVPLPPIVQKRAELALAAME
jgi:phosphate transport system substrate-binding protein